MAPNTLTVANQVVNIFDVTEDNGEDGTTSPDALIYYQDSNYYPSLDGFKTDGTQPQLQTFISTRRITNTIQPDISTLNADALSGAVGLATEGRLYFAVPVNAPNNNQIWVLDLDRGGGWMKPWYVSADWMMLYNSNTNAQGGDGLSHFTVLQNNMIYEFSYQRLSNDNGVPFSSGFSSGRVFFRNDQRVCAKLLYVIITVLRPSGRITIDINAQFRDKDSPIFASNSINVQPNSAIVGWSESSWSTRAWSEYKAKPTTDNRASVDIKVKVGKECRWFTYDLKATDANVNYEVSEAVAEYVTTGIRDV
jgi:hypothetical protein